MVTILLDTMTVIELLTDPKYQKLAIAVDEEKIRGVVSTLSLTEIYKVVGMEDERKARDLITRLIASKLEIKNVDAAVARKAGELKLRYRMPTADSLIAATGIMAGAAHVLTEDEHFQTVKALIKPVSLSRVEKMI